MDKLAQELEDLRRPEHHHGTLVHRHGGAGAKHVHSLPGGGYSAFGQAFMWRCTWPGCEAEGGCMETFRSHMREKHPAKERVLA